MDRLFFALGCVSGFLAVGLGAFGAHALKDRLDEFIHDGRDDFLLAVSEELRGSKDDAAIWPASVLSYKASLDARTLLAAIERR